MLGLPTKSGSGGDGEGGAAARDNTAAATREK